MKPSGVSIESFFDTDTTHEMASATLSFSPDETGGVFFSGGAFPCAGDNLRVPVTVEDAIAYKQTKSLKSKQKIIDRYVINHPEGSHRYSFPLGAFLGQVVVNHVLEVDASVIKRKD